MRQTSADLDTLPEGAITRYQAQVCGARRPIRCTVTVRALHEFRLISATVGAPNQCPRRSTRGLGQSPDIAAGKCRIVFQDQSVDLDMVRGRNGLMCDVARHPDAMQHPPELCDAVGMQPACIPGQMKTLSVGDVRVLTDANKADRESLHVTDLVRRYHTSLIGFLRNRLRVAEDAPDVAQEAYLRMMQYEGSREIDSPSSLLFRIAINVANDFGRAEQVRHAADHCELNEFDLDSGLATPERAVAAEQDLDRLYVAIQRLPPKCRQVFLLSRAHDMTYPQIAQHCGISVKMVEKHISHALAVCMAEVG
jgi:RNA polymerase sigma-70 factor (ECF subfamily)